MIVDKIREQNLEAANSLSLLKDMISDFKKFSQIMEQRSNASSCLAATSFDTYKKACEAVGVNYNMQDLDHHWELREPDSLSAYKCIKELWGSDSVDMQESETFCRTIMDLVFLDRLRVLKDENATRHLKFVPEVSLSVERGGATITGRADWCLGYGNARGGFESTLIIMEAKKLGTAQSGLPQLIIYLAAVLDARKDSHNMDSAVFGLLTDSSVFQFVYLDPARKLFTSRLLQWVTDKKRIVQWIDRVLEDSIKASPHTTPVKSSNRTLRAYQTELKRGHSPVW
ncbi:predicted protein [Histoplasma capsulatum var. duboisii H88]|uniref:Predicted protein n=2 Tax=Ajellomyces capsulatus (strain H88) TaxID=544711 RepID=F0UK48_AJEC8|nr:predicted protein [Histoplasma capsulatum var. duboisii H88]